MSNPVRTASAWHGGQTSALYSFASTGQRWFPLAWYRREIQTCLNYPTTTEKEARRLKRLFKHLRTLPRVGKKVKP